MRRGRNAVRRIVIGGAMLAVSGLLVASTSLYGSGAGAAPADAPVIALVNEDEPASFNDTSYVFGREFVSLVANDTRYDWEVVSRSVAEKAYADNAVSAVIVLPRSFSHDILTLQDLNPLKAVVDYKVSPGDTLSRERLQNEVFTILKDFNSRVVTMYFASVAGNISGAQVNMDAVVDGQSRLVEALSSDFHPSIEKVGAGEKSSIGLSEILRSMNSAWIAAQNSFTESTTRSLTSASSSLAAQQPALTDYFALQEQIARANIANANGAIVTQGSSDKEFYDQAFSNHVGSLLSGDGAWSGLAGLSSVDADGNRSGALATLTDTVDGYNRLAVDYNTRIAGVLASLDEQRATLEDSKRALLDLEQRLLREYFEVELPAGDTAVGVPAGDTSITDATYRIDPNALTEDMARGALAQRLSDTFAADGSTAAAVKKYQDRVGGLLDVISTDPAQYEPLFTAMKAADPAFDPAPYQEQLDLIRRYNQWRNAAAPTLTVVTPQTAAAPQSATTTVPVTAAPGERLVVKAALPGQLASAHVDVSLPAAPNCDPANPSCVAIDPAAQTATVDNTAGTLPLSMPVAFTIDLTGVTGSATVDYVAQNIAADPADAPRIVSSSTYLLAPPSAAAAGVGNEVGSIAAYLGKVQSAAGLLQFLYGSPDDTADTFRQAVAANGDFAALSGDSLLNRYGSIGAATIREALSATDVQAYQQLGRDNIAAIIAQINAVRTELDRIAANTAELSGLHLSDSYFSDVLDQLESWYAAAMTSISAAPERWDQASNDVIQLTTVPWRGQKEGKAELYLDDRTGPSLYETISHLVEATSRDAGAVAAGARAISDNSDQFEALLAGVQSTQAETQAVLAAMNGTITTGSADLAAGSEFSKRFSTVLSNTRASGVDPATIYEHFANPVAVKDQTPVAGPLGAEPFDYRWIAIFAAGSLIGALLVLLSQLLARRRRNARAEP